MKNTTYSILPSCVAIILLLIFISIYYKTSDFKAYEDVIATMSMEKANNFFTEYPNSSYKDRLVNEIIEWCKQQRTEECYRMILTAIPKDHIRYNELLLYYKTYYKKDGL